MHGGCVSKRIIAFPVPLLEQDEAELDLPLLGHR